MPPQQANGLLDVIDMGLRFWGHESVIKAAGMERKKKLDRFHKNYYTMGPGQRSGCAMSSTKGFLMSMYARDKKFLEQFGMSCTRKQYKEYKRKLAEFNHERRAITDLRKDLEGLTLDCDMWGEDSRPVFAVITDLQDNLKTLGGVVGCEFEVLWHPLNVQNKTEIKLTPHDYTIGLKLAA